MTGAGAETGGVGSCSVSFSSRKSATSARTSSPPEVLMSVGTSSLSASILDMDMTSNILSFTLSISIAIWGMKVLRLLVTDLRLVRTGFKSEKAALNSLRVSSRNMMRSTRI